MREILNIGGIGDENYQPRYGDLNNKKKGAAKVQVWF